MIESQSHNSRNNLIFLNMTWSISALKGVACTKSLDMNCLSFPFLSFDWSKLKSRPRFQTIKFEYVFQNQHTMEHQVKEPQPPLIIDRTQTTRIAQSFLYLFSIRMVPMQMLCLYAMDIKINTRTAQAFTFCLAQILLARFPSMGFCLMFVQMALDLGLLRLSYDKALWNHVLKDQTPSY